MSDCRGKLISSIEASIVIILDPEDREKVIRKIIGHSGINTTMRYFCVDKKKV